MRLALLAATLLAAAPALADTATGIRFAGELVDRDGANAGSVSIFATESGVVRVNVSATGLAPGGHGIHVHETGLCEGDFTSAGGHLAGGMEHGLVEGGPHPGDLPNGFVEEDGALNYEAFNERLVLDAMLGDDDGAALIIHSEPDDYESQPSGDAGDRVLCAVLELEPAG